MTLANHRPLRRPGRRTAVGGLLALLALLFVGPAPAASASVPAAKPPRCATTSLYAPIVGSWYAQVYFPGQPFPGRTESTLITFTPGGGVVEANPVNVSPAANSGFWRRNADCSYFMHQVHFTWDPKTTGMEQAFTVDVLFTMADDNHFKSHSATAVVHQFDPQTGKRVFGPFTVPNVSEFFGERLSVWTVPENFPAEPIPQ
ncbi:hypothetical protein GCM10010172_19420 [Paractinoplanes ferrugineus]|uniref:Uncharacterized protein n=1 Tax=Paractinoplanes ferrugineus TaxID=113564 RepID=A0A919JAC5_9ACTN|nr:hypothetical protein [Actinoplanes ferrugineus]GIE16227.1 hypothetical protein Afe05nite_80670 [Actinoplanes ferrugineus]